MSITGYLVLTHDAATMLWFYNLLLFLNKQTNKRCSHRSVCWHCTGSSFLHLMGTVSLDYSRKAHWEPVGGDQSDGLVSKGAMKPDD